MILISDTKFITEAPNLNLKTSRRARSTDGEFVRYVEDRHRSWLNYHENSRKRMYDVIEAILDINGGMWPERERNDLERQDRHIVSINIARQKMETLNGSLMSEKFDFDFKPLDMEVNQLVENIKHWYFADKDQYNYDIVDSNTNMSGLCHSGVQGMFIDHSIRRTGAIAFKQYADGTVLQDPYWQNNINKSWREAMIDGYLTPAQMIEQFHTNNPTIHKLADADYYIGDTYEQSDNVRAWEDLPRRDGSRFLVTEYRWLEKLQTTRLHAKMPTGEWFAFPLKVSESQVRDFINQHRINWNDVREYPYEDNILYYGIVCPDLAGAAPDLVFVRGKHPIQCGAIGLFKFSSSSMYGIDKGVFEYLLDLNRTLNYRQSKIDDIIASAASGMVLVNEDKVGGNEGVRKLMQNKTRPDYVHPVKGSPQGVAELFPVGNVPEHLFREVNNIIDLMDRVSPVTPALEGAKETDESGVLFRMRNEIAQLGAMRLYANWQQFLMDKAEAWYNQAQITYKDLYRKVPSKDSSGFIEFNVPAFRDTPNGREKVYMNSVGDLPRARVVVTLSKSSPTKKMARRLELFDTTKMLSAHPELFKNEIRILTNDLISTIERSPEEQMKLERMQDLQEMRDILEMFTQMEQLKAQGMEAQAMQKQLSGMMQNMQMQQAGAPSAAPEQYTPANQRIPNEEQEPAVEQVNRPGPTF